MKFIIVTVAGVAATATVLLAAPAASYAQSSESSHSTLTRAQVRQELFDLESVGYDPIAADDENYPGDIVAAQERLAAKRVAERKHAEPAYGSNGIPVTESGAPAVAAVKQ
ncbi:DUF4148 domain-containing protein [Burkholderia metallica]|uniref:DUF4148 domain-containing protein n=1 Tax=Burkholderia metallica TaxID=488729 RepID=A0ABT8PGW6_9BURK|nr:DUF4148 domain-containing protein [Burkholderia metallica]MDN7934376.1 DUF4148 domain-containing protein [Burkholderia metallica]VWB23615.1 purine nucleoside phosphorylase [Burkholderia metallica]